MKKILKIMVMLPVFMIVMVVGMIVVMMKMDHKVDYEVSTANTEIPQFTEMEIPFDHQLNPDESLPFVGSAIIDIDNDGQEEFFLGGSVRTRPHFCVQCTREYNFVQCKSLYATLSHPSSFPFLPFFFFFLFFKSFFFFFFLYHLRGF